MATLVCPLAEAACRWSNRPAVISGKCNYSYQAWHRRIDTLATKMSNAGVRHGQVIATIAGDPLRQCELFIACWRIGAIWAPFNPRWRHHQLVTQLNTLRPDWLYTDIPGSFGAGLPEAGSPASGPPAGSLLAGIPELRLDGSDEPHESGEFSSRNYDLLENAIVDLLQTSGTSGDPKFVAHNLGNHLASARASKELIPLEPGSRWLLCLPMYHVAGVAILIRCIESGAAVVLEDSNKDLFATLRARSVTHLSLVNPQLAELLDQDVKQPAESLRYLLLGGSRIDSDLLKRAVAAGYNCFSSYGMTEASSQVYTEQAFSDGSREGHFLAWVNTKLENSGELKLRGSALASGYWQDGRVSSFRDAKGWFATGDLAKIENGRLLIKGRVDNRFVCGGENLQAEYIEQQIGRHPLIKQVLVVPVPDAKWGQVPVAFIDWQDQPEPGQWHNWLSKYLNRLQMPRKYLPWSEVVFSGLKFNRRASAKVAADRYLADRQL